MAHLKPSEIRLLKLIKQEQPVSKYDVYKKSGLKSYGGVWFVIEVLIQKGLVVSEKGLSKNGERAVVNLRVKE